MGKFTIQMAQVLKVTKIRCDAYVSMTYRNIFFFYTEMTGKVVLWYGVFLRVKWVKKSTIQLLESKYQYIENFYWILEYFKTYDLTNFLKIPQLYY